MPTVLHDGSPDWVLKTEQSLGGESLSYLDMMERNVQEDNRRARERQIMDEGQQMWQQKKQEETDLNQREMAEVRDMARAKMFGRPGNGAPTVDVRKKKFTEHQLDHDQKKGGEKDWEAEEAPPVRSRHAHSSEDYYDSHVRPHYSR
jgi:hypothetical protein